MILIDWIVEKAADILFDKEKEAQNQIPDFMFW